MHTQGFGKCTDGQRAVAHLDALLLGADLLLDLVELAAFEVHGLRLLLQLALRICCLALQMPKTRD